MERMNRNVLKRILIIGYMSLIFVIVGWLFFQSRKPETLPIGSPMPKIGFITANSSDSLGSDRIHKTIVVLFSPDCDHCKFQLKRFDNDIKELANVRIFLLTTDEDFFSGNDIHSWPALESSSNVEWGIVKKGEIKQNFGRLALPSIFLFDENGVLFYKIKGEVMLRIVLNKLYGLNRVRG